MKKILTTLSLVCLLFIGIMAVNARTFTGPTVTNVGPVGAITGFTKRVYMTAASPEGCALTYSIVSGPANGTLSQLNTATGLVLYKSNAGFTGMDTFTFQATAFTTGSCTTGSVTSSTGTVTLNVQNTRTTITGHLTQPDGTTPQTGQVVWTLAQTATTFDGVFIVSGSSVARTLDSGGNYTVSLYSTVGLSPNVFYVATLVQGSARSTLGYFQIPASSSTVNQATLNTNQIYKLGDAQVQLATADQVEALANEVDAITLTHTLLGPLHSDTVTSTAARGGVPVVNSAGKYAQLPLGPSGQYPRSNGTDLVYSAIQNADLPSTIDGKTFTNATITNPTTSSPTINGGTITGANLNGGTITGTFTGAGVINGAQLLNNAINNATINGGILNCATVSCIGLAGATGGISNTVGTNIISDSDNNGSGRTSFMIGPTEVLGIENGKTITFSGPYDLKAQSAPSLSTTGFARFYYDTTLHQVMLSTEGGAFQAITAATTAAATTLRYDVQRDFGASGSDQQTTGSLTGGTTTLTLANAKDFINGDGIMIAGAGTSGHNCVRTVSSGGGTTTITLSSSCPTTVSGAAVKHDDSAAINAALAAAGTAGGGNILFKANDRNGLPGKYHVAGALQSNCNSILCFPQNPITGEMMRIGLIGEYTPFWGGKTRNAHGVIIDASDWNDSTPSNYGAIISAKTYALPTSNASFNYVVPFIENMTFRTGPDPLLSGVVMGGAQGLHLHNFVIDNSEPAWFDPGVAFSTITQPTHTGSVALMTPNANNYGDISISNGAIWGFYNGGIGGEHLHADDIQIIYVMNGWTFNDGAGDSTGNLLVSSAGGSAYLFTNGGIGFSSTELAMTLHVETTNNSAWYDTPSGHGIYDPSNYGLGHVILMADGHLTTSNLVTGAANLSIFYANGGKYALSGTNAVLTVKNTDSALSAGSQFNVQNDQGDALILTSYGSTYGVTALRRNQSVIGVGEMTLQAGLSGGKKIHLNLGTESNMDFMQLVGGLPAWSVNAGFNGSNYTLNNTSLTGWVLAFDDRSSGTDTVSLVHIAPQSNPATTTQTVWKANADGSFSAKGTTTNSNAAAGNLGEFVNSLVASGSAVSLTTATAANVTSISLTAGDWDVEGNCNFNYTTATVTAAICGISTTSATLPSDGSEAYSGLQLTTATTTTSITMPRKRISLSGTTTVYIIGKVTFSAGTAGEFGTINARRVQ